MNMNAEVKVVWKWGTVILFNVAAQHLLRGIEEGC